MNSAIKNVKLFYVCSLFVKKYYMYGMSLVSYYFKMLHVHQTYDIMP
jgi:hypothetical protein